MTCTLPLVASGSKEAALTILSVSGLAFEVEGEPTCTPGTSLGATIVRAGVCSIRGDAMVRSVKPLGAERFEIGCLFVPDSAAAEDRWMALVSGVEVALGLRGE